MYVKIKPKFVVPNFGIQTEHKKINNQPFPIQIFITTQFVNYIFVDWTCMQASNSQIKIVNNIFNLNKI